jgi:two-component system sensor histidine kinase BaeS
MHRVTQRFAPLAHQQGLTLRVRPPYPSPVLAVCWDFGRIEQLLNNLLTNSLRYTQAPGGIWVDWQATATEFTLTVEDSPPGVGDEELTQLFEPLYRTDAARQRDRQHEHGSGLGLAIVRTIVQAHQGRVWAGHSTQGGLKITACWPLRPHA